jgi:hypothetical protein
LLLLLLLYLWKRLQSPLYSPHAMWQRQIVIRVTILTCTVTVTVTTTILICSVPSLLLSLLLLLYLWKRLQSSLYSPHAMRRRQIVISDTVLTCTVTITPTILICSVTVTFTVTVTVTKPVKETTVLSAPTTCRAAASNNCYFTDLYCYNTDCTVTVTIVTSYSYCYCTDCTIALL